MSALGQKQTLKRSKAMSALPPKADIGTQPCDVCFVPKAVILDASRSGPGHLPRMQSINVACCHCTDRKAGRSGCCKKHKIFRYVGYRTPKLCPGSQNLLGK